MAVRGIGIDLCAVDRMRRVLGGRHGEHFARRVFTEAERAYCSPRTNAAESFAGRFAAKEALVKALGSPPGLAWHHMEIRRHESGAPFFELTGVAEEVTTRFGYRVHVSITHERTTAAAVVVLEDAS